MSTMPRLEPEVARVMRDNILRKVLTKLREHFISEEKAVELLMVHYADRCKPPVFTLEAERIARQVYVKK